MCDETENAINNVSADMTNTISINVTIDSVSTDMTNTISTNVTSTVSTNSDDKKVKYKMGSYILHTVLLVIILLFIILIIYYHYAKDRSKQINALLN